jgi:hypothetical protein
MESLRNIGVLFVEPGKAMDAVRARSMLLPPLALLVLGTAAIQFWYYQVVDFPWLLDQMFNARSGMEPDQVAMTKKLMTRGMMAGSSIAGSLILIPLMLLVQAGYLVMVARIVGNELPFGKWFAFATWSSVPSLLLLPVMAVRILTARGGQLSPDALNPLTLNALAFHVPMDNPYHSLLSTLNVVMVWSIVVTVIGFARWTGKGRGTSIAVAVLPYVVVFGIWAAIATGMAP